MLRVLDQRSKTDALDSKMLSMLGCERKLTPWNTPSETMEALRFLSRERATIIKERSIEKNRNHAMTTARFEHKKAIGRFDKSDEVTKYSNRRDRKRASGINIKR